jgi:hypothetical protein
MPIFPLTLYKTYLEQGFFNVSRDFDKYVRLTEGTVELLLLSDGKQQRVEAKINRSTNEKGTARILGGPKLRDWFHHFDVGARLDVDLASAGEIRIQKSGAH